MYFIVNSFMKKALSCRANQWTGFYMKGYPSGKS